MSLLLLFIMENLVMLYYNMEDHLHNGETDIYDSIQHDDDDDF